MHPLKSAIQWILQFVLGYERYLFVFSNFKVLSLKNDRSEKDFFRFLNLLPEEGNVLDVGANIGIMTTHLSRSLKGKVLAIEPEPVNARVLRRMLRFHNLNNVEVEEIAVGSEVGKLTMVLPVVHNVRKQGLSHVKDPSIKDFNEGIEFEVEVRKIDDLDFVKTHRIAGIKIDVENFEFPALIGARELITRDRPLVYAELWDNENRANCFALFQSLNYSIEVWNEGNLQAFNPDQHHTQNFFFRPIQSISL